MTYIQEEDMPFRYTRKDGYTVKIYIAIRYSQSVVWLSCCGNIKFFGINNSDEVSAVKKTTAQKAEAMDLTRCFRPWDSDDLSQLRQMPELSTLLT